MSRKKIIIAIFGIAVLLVIGMLIKDSFIAKDEEVNPLDKVNRHREEQYDEANVHELYTILVTKEIEDGWVLNITLQKDLYDNAYTWLFNGDNFKYKKLPDFEAYWKNGKTGEILGEFEADHMYLSVSEGVRGVETKAIEEFLNNKYKYEIKKVTLEDLKELEITFFDKQILVDMMNEAFDKILNTSAEIDKDLYNYSPMSLYIEEFERDGYFLQFGYMLTAYCIEYINIEMVSETRENKINVSNSDAYLSNLVANKHATPEQIELYNNLELIEKTIKENNSFKFWEYLPELKGDVYDRLRTLMERETNNELIENIE